jgi:hypothetical protein
MTSSSRSLVALAAAAALGACSDPDFVAHASGVPNAFGIALTAGPENSADGILADLGTNGRICESCHHITNGWILTPSEISGRFATGTFLEPGGFASNESARANDELDPLFRLNDGTVSPHADVSSPAARAQAYALLLGKALIRIGLPMPDGAEFSLRDIDDPYGFAGPDELSLFRRTLLMSNVTSLTTLMWDGRESAPELAPRERLAQQASHAVTGHAQATAEPSEKVLGQIVDDESDLFFAQSSDNVAGDLDASGAHGGPFPLIDAPFYPGMNSYPGPDPQGAPFSPEAFKLYGAWASDADPAERGAARRSIARGEALFNTRTFSISGVRGLNDALGRAAIQGTCSTCHNLPQLGGNADGLLFDVGVSDEGRRTKDLPLYTFVRGATQETIRTSDPGRALITGRWRDMNAFKVPSLRGLAGRPPYFHDGSAATIADIVDYFDARFAIGLTASEKQDLIAFLAAL